MPKSPGSFIGGGSEKSVYQDSVDPENKVYGEFHDPVEFGDEPFTKNQIKAAFYLGKLSHLLFPNSTADQHGAGMKPRPFVRMSKIELDEELKEYNDSGHASDELYEKIDGRSEDPKVISLDKLMEKSGILIDPNGTNFSFDKSGKPIYLDTDLPWIIENRAGKKTIISRFNPKRLQSTIQNLPSPQKADAEKYFDRLIILYNEDKKLIQK